MTTKLTLRTYAGYAAGDMANNLAFSMQGMFLLIYYTNVVGLDPAGVAVVLLVVRIIGAFSDLVAGRMVDLTETRWGRFRPYLVFASPPLLLMSVATFTVPAFGGNQTWQYLYAATTLSLLGMLYSAVTIPYGSLATVMTKDPVERARLGVWRMLGPVVTMLGLAVIVSPQITRYATDPAALQSFLTRVTLVFAVVGFLLYWFCFTSTHEAERRPARAVTILQTFHTLTRNRPLAILCVSDLVFLTGLFGVHGAMAYYATYVLGDSATMVWMIVAMNGASLATMPVIPRLVGRFGKKSTYYVGAVGIVVFGTAVFFVPPTLAAVIPVFFLFGLFQSISLSLAFAFQADTVEYGEWRTGRRTEGATYAVYSFFRKISQATAGAVVGYALALGGFSATLTAQPESAVVAIRAVVGLGPAVLALLGAAIFLAYPLTDVRYRRMVEEVRERHVVRESESTLEMPPG